MAPETRTLLSAVLALSEAERALLVDQLLEAEPDASADEMSDEALEAELDQRFEDYRRDPTSAIPWSDIRRAR